MRLQARVIGGCLLLLTVLSLADGKVYAQPASASGVNTLEYYWPNPARTEVIYFLHDSRSVMWMLTTTDVFSFDGIAYKSYGAVFPELRRLQVVRAGEDKAGNIWLLGLRDSKLMVYVFKPAEDELLPLHIYLGLEQAFELPVRDNQINFFGIHGNIWLGSSDQAYLYNGQWQQVYHLDQYPSTSRSWWPAKNGFWTAGGGKGMLYYENSSGKVIDSISHQQIGLWIDDQLNLWGIAAHRDESLPRRYVKFSFADGKIRRQWTDELPVFSWINDINTLTTTNASARYGREIVHENNNYFLLHNGQRTPLNLKDQLSGTTIRNPFFFDRDGGLWSSNRKTIFRIVFNNRQPFNTWLKSPSQDFSIRGMAQLGNWLYIHTYKGEYRLQLETYTIESYPLAENQGLAMYSDGSRLWSGRHAGKVRCVLQDGSVVQYQMDLFTDVYSFLTTAAGKTLVGTANGLYFTDEESLSLKPTRLTGLSVTCLYANAQGIWVGSGNGLYRVDEEGVVQAHFLKPDNRLAFKHLQHIFEDFDGSFWLATRGGGLIHWYPHSNEYRQYTTDDGLSNNDIHAVYADAFGYLWLPSNDGLMRLHKDSGRVKAYYKGDGLADNEFNSFSHFQAGDGRLFLGGVNGITSFAPKDIPVQESEEGDLQLMEVKSYRLEDGIRASQLEAALAGRPLIIRPEDSYLEIQISPLLYEEPANIRYAWMLEGYHNQWIQQTASVIRLINIPYGDYTLRVRYSQQDNNWATSELQLPVSVIRPFYRQWYFLTFVILALMGAGWALNSWRNRRLIQANVRLEAEVKQRTYQIEQDKELISRQAQELQSLDEMKTRFFANVTHELRTPLTMIIGPVERLLQGRVKAEKVNESLQTIQRNALRQLNLVEELLDLSRIDAKRLGLQEQPVNFFGLLSRTLAAFSPYAEHRNVVLRMQYDASKDALYLLDQPKWEKIINNLLDNALKFTMGGGCITASVQQEAAQLRVQVADTGQGIHPDDLPFIFDRYFQSATGDATLRGGAGIGLSICREYVNLFGGELTVESEWGKGSVFTILFTPFVVDDAGTSQVYQQQMIVVDNEKLSGTAAPTAGRSTILLVEDDKETADYIRSIFYADYNLLVANNGRMALRQLEDCPVDMVISDVMMPEMDGFQLLQAIKEKQTDMPVMLLTARVEVTDRLNALRLGVDDYITKPFLEEELAVRVKNLLKRQGTRRLLRLTSEVIIENEVVVPFDQKWLSALEKIVRSHLSDPSFSVQRMADAMNISERSLRYKVKAYTGLNPNQYLLEARLERARYLLENMAYETVSEVCFAVGLNSQRYFSKLMKERFGKLPSEF